MPLIHVGMGGGTGGVDDMDKSKSKNTVGTYIPVGYGEEHLPGTEYGVLTVFCRKYLQSTDYENGLPTCKVPYSVQYSTVPNLPNLRYRTGTYSVEGAGAGAEAGAGAVGAQSWSG